MVFVSRIYKVILMTFVIDFNNRKFSQHIICLHFGYQIAIL